MISKWRNGANLHNLLKTLYSEAELADIGKLLKKGLGPQGIKDYAVLRCYLWLYHILQNQLLVNVISATFRQTK